MRGLLLILIVFSVVVVSILIYLNNFFLNKFKILIYLENSIQLAKLLDDFLVL